ncbi:MAG TPA: aspartyl/asparaginyl beta-hydroxylase domain-containing protein [Dokdonella sp.]
MNQTSIDPPNDLTARGRAAFDLAQQGRGLEAERAYADLLRDAPGHVDALNFLAIRAHARGDRAEALRLLEQARREDATDLATRTNLGVLYREQGKLEESFEALSLCLETPPAESFVPRLRLAEVMQSLGRHQQALPTYFGAIWAAQGRGFWLDSATTPVELSALVLHAMRYVEQGRRALFFSLLNPLRDRYGSTALARVEKSLAIYLGDLTAHYPEPKQRPKFLYFPDLPAPRYFERELFPWYAELEAQTDVIRAEMLAALGEDSGFEPFLGHSDDQRALQDHLRGERGTPAWNALFFHRHGVRNEENARRCPRTAAALDAAPLCRIRDHSPEACFSVLTPGSHILPHHGVTNTRVVTHLPLVVPDDCALVVAGELRRWQEGTCFSFDDTFEHEAWNRSADTRVVMLLDAWNPYLTEIERLALTDLIGAIGDFNRAAGV